MRGHALRPMTVQEHEPDQLYCFAAAWCECGEYISGVSASPRLCQRAIRARHRAHLKTLRERSLVHES